MANSLATALEAGTLLIFMRRRLGGLEGRRVLIGTSQAVLATIAMLLVVWGWINLTNARQAWLVGGGGVIIGGFVYGLGVLGLKVPEVQSVLNLLRRRLKPALK